MVEKAQKDFNISENPDTYDKLFASGGYKNIYSLPYWRSPYYLLFRPILKELSSRNVKSVLEVGCGNGALAHMILEKTKIQYKGFDFSPLAVRGAIDRTGYPEAFYVADATEPSSYTKDYDCIICVEVLEHIETDIEVMRYWRKGCKCICSVPNFDSRTHVRYFQNEEQIRERYGQLLEITDIIRIKSSPVPKLSWQTYLRQMAKSIYRLRPKLLKKTLGLASFDEGGIFLLLGERK